MEEISQTKEKFLKHVGIDINNLPPEFNKISKSYDSELTTEEKDFLFSDSYTKTFVLPFSMKDIVGTSHPSYENITFLEAFIKSKRGDENISKFYSNPAYYSETLKRVDQTSAIHDTPIELNRDSVGNCYIRGGNNRINLLMMTYLKELSECKTEEDKEKVNEKYTFYAEIRSLPKNKDVNNSIFMLKEIYKDNIKFSFIGNSPDDCHFLVQLDEQQIEIKSVEELKSVLHQTYSLEGLNAVQLYSKLVTLISDYNHFKGQENVGKLKLLNEICPEIEEIKDLFLNIRLMNNSYTVFEDYDLSSINYSNLKQFLNNVNMNLNETPSRR